jgi:hypothetical protein
MIYVDVLAGGMDKIILCSIGRSFMSHNLLEVHRELPNSGALLRVWRQRWCPRKHAVDLVKISVSLGA